MRNQLTSTDEEEEKDEEEEDELGDDHVVGEVGGLGVVGGVEVSDSELEEQVNVCERWVDLGWDEDEGSWGGLVG